jgi:hypothetical protein
VLLRGSRCAAIAPQRSQARQADTDRETDIQTDLPTDLLLTDRQRAHIGAINAPQGSQARHPLLAWPEPSPWRARDVQREEEGRVRRGARLTDILTDLQKDRDRTTCRQTETESERARFGVARRGFRPASAPCYPTPGDQPCGLQRRWRRRDR